MLLTNRATLQPWAVVGHVGMVAQNKQQQQQQQQQPATLACSLLRASNPIDCHVPVAVSGPE
jgi:hypothetical protein